jgi:galactose-1-phosphate uridylyltransferase
MILLQQPTYYSKVRMNDDIYCHSTSALGDFSDEIKQDLANNFSKCIKNEDNKFEIPDEFHLVHPNIVGKGSQGKVETEAL